MNTRLKCILYITLYKDITVWQTTGVLVAIDDNIYVVVQFYPWFKFYFPLFLGMVIYDNEYRTKENKI